ncbi:MAG: DUF188 domain-containing protein [Erysipelotrichaceae bacterium]
MNIWIDGDGCPVVNETIELALYYGIKVTIVCDYAHVYQNRDVEVILVDTGRDNVDYALLARCKAGDVVVTQDYGLAALVLSKQGYAINQYGQEYHDGNINELLTKRAMNQVQRKHHKYSHIAKRTSGDDQKFIDGFMKLLDIVLSNN